MFKMSHNKRDFDSIRPSDSFPDQVIQRDIERLLRVDLAIRLKTEIFYLTVLVSEIKGDQNLLKAELAYLQNLQDQEQLNGK